jgi:hypothetical protein
MYDNSFQKMLSMYENEREVIIYMIIVNKEILYRKENAKVDFKGEFTLQNEDNFKYYEEGSYYCPSEESYLHSEGEE